MHRLVQSVLLVILLFPLYGQVNLIDGIEWEYKMSNGFIPELNANRVTIKGDTVVNGQDCKILEREYINCNLRPKQDYIYQEDNRIYFYHFEDSLFQLLYDFNVEIGDIVKVRDWDIFAKYQDHSYFRTDSISYVQIGTNLRKRFIMSYGELDENGELEFTKYQYEIIEGIGCTVNFFYWFDTGWCDGNHVNKLKCYYHPELGNYGNMSECAITSDVLEAEKENLPTIYPNPFSDEINIRFVESVRNGIIKIYNTQGSILVTKRIGNPKNVLKLNSISNLPNGMYFITILDSEGGDIISEKLIKID